MYYRAAALLWMALIFIFSADPGSGSRSLLIAEAVQYLCGLLSVGSPDIQFLENLHFLMRKAAHMTEFAVLFFLWKKSGLKYWQAGLISMLYAASDEWHQTFVPNRFGCFSDVCIDSAGSALCWIGMKICSRLKAEKGLNSQDKQI